MTYQGIKQSESLRQSILNEAFVGRLVSQNQNDEPAEKLLERIKAERLKRKAKTSAGSINRKSKIDAQVEMSRYVK